MADECGLELQLDPAATTDTFFVYRPGTQQSLQRRDLELQWSAMFTHSLPSTIKKTLDRFGESMADPTFASNPFGAGYSDVRLAFDYMQATSAFKPYTSTDSVGFVIGNEYGGVTGSNPPRRRDYGHLDLYLKGPGQGAYNTYPSSYTYVEWSHIHCTLWELASTAAR